ncbi:MAG: TlyA family RNA methyltransferase [Peptococcaceae bacterium]|nr:TlyA family RNA methyltransferase [Peptococcaceae bacterium]
MAKKRLDVVLVEKGLAASREKAKALIMAGKVLVNEQKIDKAGTEVNPELPIRLLGQDIPYVSRGGLKLEKALQVFPVDLTGKVVADIGASTGGFVDCALQNGAVKVFAVDVGYNQLDWKLRTDERVINMEKTNARYLEADSLGEMVDVVTTDVSFISLDKILPPAMTFLKEGGHVLALIKPQFEAGKENVGKKGVVRDPAVHRDVVEKILALCDEINLTVWGLDFSPVKGPEGNIEYLLWGCKNPDTDFVPDAAAVVAAAHDRLD